jgi:hypothetical protein
MGKKEKIFRKAKNSPANVDFDELCYLAEKVKCEFRNQSGSHKTYKHSNHNKMFNFQPDKNGKAKPYQVRQLINFIDEYNLMEE